MNLQIVVKTEKAEIEKFDYINGRWYHNDVEVTFDEIMRIIKKNTGVIIEHEVKKEIQKSN